jgi:hypothetical protein
LDKARAEKEKARAAEEEKARAEEENSKYVYINLRPALLPAPRTRRDAVPEPDTERLSPCKRIPPSYCACNKGYILTNTLLIARQQELDKARAEKEKAEKARADEENTVYFYSGSGLSAAPRTRRDAVPEPDTERLSPCKRIPLAAVPAIRAIY